MAGEVYEQRLAYFFSVLPGLIDLEEALQSVRKMQESLYLGVPISSASV